MYFMERLLACDGAGSPGQQRGLLYEYPPQHVEQQ